jgi:hypothetical protein
MPGGSLAAQASCMELTTVLYREAEMAYRTSYLTEQLQRSGARKHRADGSAATARSRRIHLRWHPHHASAA